jgi:hypothetical protein
VNEPTPEQVSAAREFYREAPYIYEKGTLPSDALAVLLAAREAEAYKRGWEACREKAAQECRDEYGATRLADRIRALEPPSGEGE